MKISSFCLVLALLSLFMLCSSGAQQAGSEAAPVVQYLKADTASTLPFSDAVRVGNMLYLSGQIGITGDMKLVPGGLEPETKQLMENIRSILERNGSSLNNVVKCTVMMADMKEWPAFNALYKTYFAKDRLPARSAFAASGLAFGARVELECWAIVR